jgi:hypothetical protein
MQASASLLYILEGYVGGQEVEVTTAHEWQGNPTALVRYVGHVEAHLARPGGISVASRLGERVAVISQDRMDSVRYSLQVFAELPCCPSVRLVSWFGGRELRGYGGLPFTRKDCTITPWDQTPRPLSASSLCFPIQGTLRPFPLR